LSNEIYDWIIVGGGIAGVSVAEILCREGKSVLLIEKNEKLASETSKEFHEWVHSGALYALVPDNLLTLRYLLGATDDLLQFYSSFPKMNLVPTESGVIAQGSGWFNDQRIEYRYRVRKANPVWMSLVSRAANIVDLLSNHDWLRRRAGSEYGDSNIQLKYWINLIAEQMNTKSKFYTKVSPDFTMNSRVLIADLLSAAQLKGLSVVTGDKVLEVSEGVDYVEVSTEQSDYRSKNIAICSPDFISSHLKIPIKTGYAPIAVVENVPEEEKSFVELDYNTKNCINLLKKDGGYGQAGGITVNKEAQVSPYLDYVIKQHQLRNPGIKVIDSYVGIKKELVSKGQERNYLYHINQNSARVWSIVLGKFTLAFSMAPEFYRRVYHANPKIDCGSVSDMSSHDLLSETSWTEIVNKKL